MTADETNKLATLITELRRLRDAADRADAEANWAKTAWDTAKNDALSAWEAWRAVDVKVQRLIRGE